MMINPEWWLILATTAVIAIQGVACEDISGGADMERYCYPDLFKNTRKSCECNNESAPPWGLRAMVIDCSFKRLQTAEISDKLPLYADNLDLSWNALELVPMLSSDSLRLLNLMHNNISQLQSQNFANVANLQELYISWNSIQIIGRDTFANLAHLQSLDLSHNNLRRLAFQVFSPLLVLQSLHLSWNRQLNQTEGIDELDFYDTFGVASRKLKTLKLEACGLSNIRLPQKAILKELDLRRNRLTEVPENLPLDLEKIDLSENLFEILTETDAQRLLQIHEMYMEDMPRLKALGENSFIPLVALRKASFQNSRHLIHVHELAFGANATRSPHLQALIFRGTGLSTFNATLSPIFFQLDALDLKGVPLLCDCNLVWLKDLRIETHGRCFKPSRLRGITLTQAKADDFSCERWPRFVYGVIILALIAFCSICIYMIGMCLRPRHHGVTMRSKVGAGSPYARVTIEPNRQEHN